LVGVIPAAGFGTRLRPLTAGALPKEMLPVGRKLALEHIVDELRAAGVGRIVFVLSPAKEDLVRQHFGEGSDTDADPVRFAYVRQPQMRGLGDAVLRAADQVPHGAAFVVALGDAVFEEPAPGGLTRRLLRATKEAGATVGLAVQRVPADRIGRYGVVRPANGTSIGDPSVVPISDIVEKPAPGEAPSDLAAAARYVLSADVFDQLRRTPPGKNNEVQLTDALRALIGPERPGVAVPLAPGEQRHDLGGLDSYFRAFAAFALRDPDHGTELGRWLDQHLHGDHAVTPSPSTHSFSKEPQA
jgi:UTP--glucose-1-phosphate uridylyltransferase